MATEKAITRPGEVVAGHPSIETQTVDALHDVEALVMSAMAIDSEERSVLTTASRVLQCALNVLRDVLKAIDEQEVAHG